MIHIPFAGRAVRTVSAAVLEGLGMSAQDARPISKAAGIVVSLGTLDWHGIGEFLGDVADSAEGDRHP